MASPCGQLSEYWYFHILVSWSNTLDFFISIFVLVHLTRYDGPWFILSLVCMLLARVLVSIAPFIYYTSVKPKNEQGGYIWRLYSMLMLFTFSCIHSLYHAGYTNNHLLQILRLRERKQYDDVNTVSSINNSHKSKYQSWVNDAVKIHIFHSYPHCLFQSLPLLFINYGLIIHESITFSSDTIIIIGFYIELFTVIITSPIWISRFYYSLSIGKDYYHYWSFFFVIFGTILDLLCFLYAFGYLQQLRQEGFFILFTRRVYAPVDPSYFDASRSLVYILWYYEFMFITISSILCGIFISIVSGSYLLWDIFRTVSSYNCQELCGGCLTICFGLAMAPIVVFGLLTWYLTIYLCLNIFILEWLILFLLLTINKFGESIPGLWEDMIEWIKLYKNKNDLIIRISCCNYHLQNDSQSIQQLIENGIIIKYYENSEHTLGFKHIRTYSELSDFSWFQFFNQQFRNMKHLPNVISIACRLCIILFIIPYFLSRIVLLLLPIIGFIHTIKQWNNFKTLLALIYIVIFIFIVFIIDKVLWHLWILMHICPGKDIIDSNGLHNQCMPKDNTLYAIKESYNNINETVTFKRNALKALCEVIELNNYNKVNDNDIIPLVVPLKIANMIIVFLPHKTMYVDYTKIGITDNIEKPLLESVDTSWYLTGC